MNPVQYKGLEVPIWWDMESCPLPPNSNPYKIKGNIELSLRKLHYSGPISIYAYGNFNKITKKVVDQLQESGINMVDIPAGEKDSVNKRALADMLDKGFDQKGNCMLISTDEGFAHVLHKLKMENHNILLAHPSTRPLQIKSSLACAANTIFLLKSLLNGEAPPQ